MNRVLKQSVNDTASSGIKSNITEVVTTNENDSLEMLLPMLAYLSRESKDRWLTWVAPKNLTARINKKVLLAYGFALDQVRIILPENNDSLLRFLWDALANGTSAHVVANLDALSEEDRIHLEEACLKGGAQGLILRTR